MPTHERTKLGSVFSVIKNVRDARALEQIFEIAHADALGTFHDLLVFPLVLSLRLRPAATHESCDITR